MCMIENGDSRALLHWHWQHADEWLIEDDIVSCPAVALFVRVLKAQRRFTYHRVGR